MKQTNPMLASLQWKRKQERAQSRTVDFKQYTGLNHCQLDDKKANEDDGDQNINQILHITQKMCFI